MINKFKKAQDPVSSATHFVGAIASFIAMIGMVILGMNRSHNHAIIISIIVFGLSSIALYTASWVYHYCNKEEEHPVKRALRTLDHSMIYILIAGTYTPIVVAFVEKPHAYYFLTIIWAIALVGIIVKLFWLQAPRMVSTVFYLLMGWALVFDFPAFSNVPLGCFVFVALGGIMYSIGAIIYILKKPNWFTQFDFHDLFHIFVMLGSVFHFLAVYIYIL
ncbi:MAG: PAQR family membrane homeostasis protein TrhA [Coprobacillaceae bacterium]